MNRPRSQDLLTVAKLAPNDASVRAALAEVKAQRRELRAEQKTAYDGKLDPVLPTQQRRCAIS